MKILIIEDHKDLAESIRYYLMCANCICECADTFALAQDKLIRYSYDSILLDIMLPDGSGFTLLNLIKKNKINSSILIISARQELDDKIIGLEAGADDYITKPFHLPELHARIRAVFRRKMLNGNNRIIFNELTLDTDSLDMFVYDTALEITPKEFELLLFFIVNKNRVLSKQSIAAHLWGDQTDNLANFDFVYQHVKNIRKKIHAARGFDYIETIYGLGYKFNSLKKPLE